MIYLLLAWLSYPIVLLWRLFAPRRPDSIVVLQTAKIGDMVCTTPVFRVIKKARPSVRLGVVIDPVTEPLLRYNPHIDELILLDRKKYGGLLGKVSFARLLYGKGFEAALILMPNVANIVTPYWAMIPKRISVYPDYIGRTLKQLLRLNTNIEYHLHPRLSMETYIKSLRHLGIESVSLDREVYSSPGAEEKAKAAVTGDVSRIGIVLGTGNEMKDWGKDNFLTLAGRLIDFTDATIFILGTDKDRPVGEQIIDYTGDARRVKNLCGEFSLDEMPEVLKRMNLVIGVDTGLVYMADALGVPVVDIAGPSDMADQKPLGKESIIIQDKRFECVPCSHSFLTPYRCRIGHRQCMTDITPSEVLRAALKTIPSKKAVVDEAEREFF